MLIRGKVGDEAVQGQQLSWMYISIHFSMAFMRGSRMVRILRSEQQDQSGSSLHATQMFNSADTLQHGQCHCVSARLTNFIEAQFSRVYLLFKRREKISMHTTWLHCATWLRFFLHF